MIQIRFGFFLWTIKTTLYDQYVLFQLAKSYWCWLLGTSWDKPGRREQVCAVNINDN